MLGLFDQRAFFCNPERSPMVAKFHCSSLAGSSHPTVSKPIIQGFMSRFPAGFAPHTSRLCLKSCINKTKSLHHRVSAPGPKWVCECFSRATMGLYTRHPRRSSRALSVKLRYSGILVPAWRRPGLETGLGTSSLGIDTGGGSNLES